MGEYDCVFCGGGVYCAYVGAVVRSRVGLRVVSAVVGAVDCVSVFVRECGVIWYG